MSKIPSIALLGVGIILLVYGLDTSNSVAPALSRGADASSGSRSIWLIVLGTLGIMAGSFGLFFRRSP